MFKFAQFVNSICDVDVNTFCISDHISVIFSVNVLNEIRVSQFSYVCSCAITPSTPQAFGKIFSTGVSCLESVPLAAFPDELLTVFNSVYLKSWTFWWTVLLTA